MKKWTAMLTGLATGLLNGLLGSGGGLVTVPLLRKAGARGPNAHATSIAIILPLSVVSAILYLQAGRVTPSAVLPFLPGGILGALVGGWLLPRMGTTLLRRAFALLLLWSGLRLLGVITL